MPLNMQSVGISFLHKSRSHWSVLQLWDLWHIFSVYFCLKAEEELKLCEAAAMLPASFGSALEFLNRKRLLCARSCQYECGWSREVHSARKWGKKLAFLLRKGGLLGWVTPSYQGVCFFPGPGWSRGSLLLDVCEEHFLLPWQLSMDAWGSWASPTSVYNSALFFPQCFRERRWWKQGSWQGWAFSTLWEVLSGGATLRHLIKGHVTCSVSERTVPSRVCAFLSCLSSLVL